MQVKTKVSHHFSPIAVANTSSEAMCGESRGVVPHTRPVGRPSPCQVNGAIPVLGGSPGRASCRNELNPKVGYGRLFTVALFVKVEIWNRFYMHLLRIAHKL